MRRKSVSLWAVLALAIGPLFYGCLNPVAAAEKQDPLAAALKDPRSSGALNILAAKQWRAVHGSAPAAIPPQYRIHHSAVNNPGADLTAQDTQSETTIVDLGGGNLVGAYNDSGSFLGGANHFTGYAWSNNGGLSWTDAGTLPASTEGDAGDPVLAAHRASGAVYMSTLDFTTFNKILVFKSTTLGHTFGAPVNATPGATGNFQDKSWITVDNFGGAGNGNVYLCWTRFGATEDILFTRSTNLGTTFGPNGGTSISAGGQGCFITVSSNHQVSVFYYRGTGSGGQGGDNKIFTRRSNDLGVTFSPEVQVADLVTTSINGDLALRGGLRSNSFPHAAAKPLVGSSDLYVVYNDKPIAGGTSEIFMVHSANGGLTWSAPLRANDDTIGDQFFPTIAVSSSGRLMVSYYSRRQDPANLMFHRQARFGIIGGGGAVTFNPSFQLSPNTPIVIGQDPVINTTYMGDYDQIALDGTNVFSPLWSDNRTADSFHAVGQPDVRFARVLAPTTTTDLAVTVTPALSTIGLGQGAAITVAVSATVAADDVFLNISAVAGLAIKSANTTSGQCTLVNGAIGCSMGAVAAGASKSVVLYVVGALAGTRTLAASGSTSTNETNIANNSASTTITVNAGNSITKYYSTGSIAVPIADLSTVNVPLTIPDLGNVDSVIAYVRLNHTYDSDLVLSLIAPTGEQVVLANRRGGSGDNYGIGANDCSLFTANATRFNDTVATPIAAGVAPFSGNFVPEQPLQGFLGVPSDGVWTLRIADTAGADTGTVGCFALRMVRNP